MLWALPPQGYGYAILDHRTDCDAHCMHGAQSVPLRLPVSRTVRGGARGNRSCGRSEMG
jgi:hypothetical protein